MRTPHSENPAGRPRKYASAADRAAAFRERWAVRTFRMTHDMARTVARLATSLDESESTVLHALLSFALANRNWDLLGISGFDAFKRLEAGGGNQGKRRASKILLEHHQQAAETEDDE